MDPEVKIPQNHTHPSQAIWDKSPKFKLTKSQPRTGHKFKLPVQNTGGNRETATQAHGSSTQLPVHLARTLARARAAHGNGTTYDHTWCEVHGCRHYGGRRPSSAAANAEFGIESSSRSNAGVEINGARFQTCYPEACRQRTPLAAPHLVQSERQQIDDPSHTMSHTLETRDPVETRSMHDGRMERWSEILCVQLQQAAAPLPRHHSFIHDDRYHKM